jgi:transcriptional regulator with XRE-family HTH domain
MREKLEFILKNKGLTATSLARMLEIQPSGLSHILSGRNKPSFDLVVKILKVFPDLNPDWLLLDGEQIFRDEAPLPTATSHAFDDGLPASPILPFDAVQNSEFSATSVEQKNELPPIFTAHKNSSGKRVERVIILYSDRSFESYTEF